MSLHQRIATSLSLVSLLFLVSSVAGFISSARSDQIASMSLGRYQSQSFETQPISATATVLDISLTTEGIFPPVLTITPGTTIRWTNQTTQTQHLEGTRFDAGPGMQLIFLPLILKADDNQSNSAVDN